MTRYHGDLLISVANQQHAARTGRPVGSVGVVDAVDYTTGTLSIVDGPDTVHMLADPNTRAGDTIAWQYNGGSPWAIGAFEPVTNELRDTGAPGAPLSDHSRIIGGDGHLLADSQAAGMFAGQLGEIRAGSVAAAMVGGGWSAGIGNLIDGSADAFTGGGTDNQIVTSNVGAIAGARGARMTNAAQSFIGGGRSPIITNALRAGIVGGQAGQIFTTAGNSDFAFIGGGAYAQVINDSQRAALVGGANLTLLRSIYASIVGASDSQAVDSTRAHIAGGYSHYVTGSNESAVNGGSHHTVTSSARGGIFAGYDHDLVTSAQSGIFAGYLNNMSDSIRAAIIAGYDILLDDADYGVVAGGYAHDLTSHLYGGIFVGSHHLIDGGDRNVIAGGYLSSITGGAIRSGVFAGESNDIDNADLAAIVGGSGHTNNHDRSVILGGINITTDAANTAFAEKLTALSTVKFSGLPTTAGAANTLYVYNDGTRKYVCIA